MTINNIHGTFTSISKPLRRFSLACLALLLYASSLPAQVKVDVKLDSLRMVEGEQCKLSFIVNCPANANPSLPQYNEGSNIVDGVEVVEVLPDSTSYTDDEKTMHLERRYLITSFDSATYVLPPFKYTVQGKDYTTKSLSLNIYATPVDTMHLDNIKPIKDVMDPPLDWKDWRFLSCFSILSVILILLAVMFYIWLCNGSPIIRMILNKPKLPPHQVAIKEIEQLKSEKELAQEDSKAYYTRLTDSLRKYIQERYGFSAMEMTSTEIIERLTQESDTVALDELTDLFRTSDLAKFAKYNALLNENDTHLVTALDYINRTKVEVDPNAKAENPDLSSDDKRHIAVKWSLRLLIVFCVVLSITLFVWAGFRLYQSHVFARFSDVFSLLRF